MIGQNQIGSAAAGRSSENARDLRRKLGEKEREKAAEEEGVRANCHEREKEEFGDSIVKGKRSEREIKNDETEFVILRPREWREM